jgi:hypothetical protein
MELHLNWFSEVHSVCIGIYSSLVSEQCGLPVSDTAFFAILYTSLTLVYVSVRYEIKAQS